MIAGFRAGDGQWPSSDQPLERVARVLEVGTRTAEETAHYPDIGMMYREGAGLLRRATDGP